MTMTDEEALVEQIIRDRKVLADDPVYHVPSREFYEQRIAACEDDLARLREEQR